MFSVALHNRPRPPWFHRGYPLPNVPNLIFRLYRQEKEEELG